MVLDIYLMSEAVIQNTFSEIHFQKTSGRVLMLEITNSGNFTFNWILAAKITLLRLLIQLII